MKHVTKLNILLKIFEGDSIAEVLTDLPDYCVSTFECAGGNSWCGEFHVSDPSAPELAEGDFVDDLCPYFPALLQLKRFYSARYELHIAVGDPAEEFWDLESNIVALLAALGASVSVSTAAWTKRTDRADARQPATALDSKSEGNQKPKSEPEGRSQ